MDLRKKLSRLNLVFVTIILFSINSAEARRRFLAKQFLIPSIEKSHLVMGSAQNSHLNPKSIKVLVWNLLKAGRKNWKADFIKMSSGKDILLLQEGYLNDTTEETFNQLRQFRFDFGVSFLYKKDKNTPTGTIVGSNVIPFKAGILRSKMFEPITKTPKTMTWAKYPISRTQKSLLVISIHGLNFTRQYAFNKQIDQAVELIDGHIGPVIFAGDFNTRTKSRFKYLKRQLQKRSLKEIGYVDDYRMSVFGNALDHTFTRGLLVRDSKVLLDIHSSDHKAMELDLVLDE